MPEGSGAEREGGGIRIILRLKQGESGEQIPKLFHKGSPCSRDTVFQGPSLRTEVLELISAMISNQEGRIEQPEDHCVFN